MKSSVAGRRLRVARHLFAAILVLSSAEVAFAAEGLTVIPDWTLLIQIANFLILIWVLNLILFRPIRNVLIRRREKINGLEDTIEISRRDVQEKEEAFAAGIREARMKGLAKKEGLMAEAADEEKKILAKINEKAQADLADVREKLAGEKESARSELMQKIDDFAETIGQKILGRTI
jgi:F-type H+-transporting ATPase subunit b